MKPSRGKTITVISGWDAWDSKGKYSGGQRTFKMSASEFRGIFKSLKKCAKQTQPRLLVIPDWAVKAIKQEPA